MKGVCTVPGCGRPRHAKGFCRRHYQQQWATGSPDIVRPNAHGTPEERFWRQVSHRGPDECWPWTGRLDKDGYGTLTIREGKLVRAHRFAYELVHGPLSRGVLVRHTCNNPPCCNETHLRSGSHLDNMADRAAAGNYATGEKATAAKFSNETVKAVREATGTYLEIGARFGMSASQVGNIRRGDQRAG